MRQVSQALLDQRFGLEPTLIVGIFWQGDNQPDTISIPTLYHAKLPNGGVGKLLGVTGIDDVQNFTGSGNTGGVTVTLDDTDDTIKSILNSQDIHKLPVNVYQAFNGADDVFLLYEGQINSPIIWSEGDRTLTITLITIVEDLDVGFSAEAGQFPNLPDAAIGQVWPMAFGQPVHVPGLTFQFVPIGQTMTNILVPDRTLQLVEQYMFATNQQITINVGLAAYYMALAAYNGDWDTEAYYQQQLIESQEQQSGVNGQQQQNIADLINLQRQYAATTSAEEAELVGPVTQGSTTLANNAKWFPINTMFYASCGGFILYGSVDAKAKFTFTIIQPPIPVVQPYTDPSTGQTKFGWIVPSWGESDMYVGPNNEIEPIFKGTAGYGPNNILIPAGYQFATSIQPEGIRFIPAGSSIQIISDIEIDYIVNIAPTTSVLRVWAYRYQNNVRSLCLVPEFYWSQEFVQYNDTKGDTGKFIATVVKLKRPLSGYAFEAWEDQIYVDLDCAIPGQIGPIMKWLIDQYTNKQVSGTDWNPVSTPLDVCSFYLGKRGNILSVLGEMAYQSRHAIYIKNGEFCLKYLSAEPSGAVMVITEDDIEAGTLEVTCDPTEELVTKIKASYQYDYAIPGESYVIVKYNDLLYGIREQDDNYYIYTNSDSIMKSVSFWAIRKGTTWKKVNFRGFLPLLVLETFDAVALNLSTNWVADGGVTGIVESCVYDAANNNVAVSMWLPIPFGMSTPHPYAYPGSLTKTVFDPYVPVGVAPQPEPPFYAGAIMKLVPLVLGDSATSQSSQLTPVDPLMGPDKEVSLTDMGAAVSDDDTATPWLPAPATSVPPPTRINAPGYNYSPTFTPTPTPTPTIPLTEACPCTIDGPGSDDGLYDVSAYPYGINDKAYQLKDVTCVQVASGTTFPPNTWTILIKTRDPKGNTNFYINPPVWLP